MKNFITAGILYFISYPAFTHPGIGIVKDSKGNIYYTDLKQVWKLDPLTQSKTVVVSGVHTHELFMDKQDNLYGEHLWYNGERLDTWGHYVWCLKNTGELVKEIEPAEGFLNNYSFTRDSSGNMYWVERFTATRFMKKDKSGNITKLAEAKLGFVSWLYATPEGLLYFTADNTVYRLQPGGKFKVMVSGIGIKTTQFSMMGRHYDSYGIWADAAGNIYIALIESKKVIRITPDGKITTVLKSGSFGTVCSGIFDNDNNLWVLENSLINEVRVRKITTGEIKNGTGSNPGLNAHFLITAITGLLAVLIFLLLRSRLNRIQNRFQPAN